VRLNLRSAFLRFAAFIAVIVKNDLPPKCRHFLVLALMIESCLQFAITEYDKTFFLDDGAFQYFVGIAPIA
jgi:hypothetical protein